MSSPPPETRARWTSRIPLLVLPLALIGAFFVLRREAGQVNYADLKLAIASTPTRSILLALLFTVLSYSLLTVYDVLGLVHIGRKLAYPKVALTSFTSYVASHNVGLAGLGGSAMRFRMYASFGLGAGEITELIGFCAISFWMGLMTVSGITFLVSPLELTGSLAWLGSTRWLGAILVAASVTSLLGAWFARHPIRIRSWEFQLPSPRILAAQLPLAALDWAASAMVVYLLLPPIEGIGFGHVFGIFMAAQTLGMLSHVPGGLGVFESIVLLLLPATAPTELVLGALVVYRIVYYLFPLLFGLACFVGFELRQGTRLRRGLDGAGRTSVPLVRAIVPRYIALATFLSGVLLIVSGSTPAEGQRMEWLADFLPLSVVELSHFSASLVGAVLLVLARSLQRRVRTAWNLTVVMLVLGLVFSLLKGFDWEEALVLAAMLGALIPCRSEFGRSAALLSGRRTAGWLVAWLATALGAGLFGFFAFQHVSFSNELWWDFAFHGDAPRFLRGLVGSTVVLTLAGAAVLMRPAIPSPAAATREDLDLAAGIADRQDHASAHLAQLGDKFVLFSEARDAFLMYAISGRTWISMGSPVGSPDSLRELIWRLRDISEAHGGRVAFYQVEEENLAAYTEAGLSPMKIGENARVPLADFGLEGSHRRGLRSNHAKVLREGGTFEMHPPGALDLAELKTISDSWLADKNTREKGFSLGFWQTEYLARCPIAVVRVAGRIVAFTNLWATSTRDELSIDLMRHLPEAPKGTMEFLFTELMLWGRAEGYAWFDLGMAPLSGIVARKNAPAWNQVAGLIYRHGEHFYNFEGLHQYKDKFHPVWTGRYLACEDGLELPFVLAELASLIAGGPLGILRP